MHEIPIAATGVLQAFCADGMLRPIDFHLARRLASLAGESDPEVQLAFALAARELRLGSVCLDLATAARLTSIRREWLAYWGAFTAAGTASAAATLTLVPVALDATPATAWLALGVALQAAATGVAAGPTDTPWLRHLPAPLVTLAGLLVAAATAATTGTVVSVAAIGGAAATVFVVGAWSTARRSAWLHPVGALGGISMGVAAIAAASALPDTSLLVAVLLLAGLEALAAGTVGHRPALLVASPVLVCAAWLTYAAGALAGDPQWFTVPIGLAVLTVVELVRHEHRRTGRPVTTTELEVLDVIGMLVLVSPTLVETATTSALYGLLGAALGALVLAWGALTRVRRRAALGAATVALSLALMVLLPLVGSLPAIEGPVLWLALASLGLLALLVAAFLEKGRETGRAVVRRLRELTDGWE